MSGDPANVAAQAATQQYGYVRCYRAIVQSCGVGPAYLYGVLEDYAQLGARTGQGCMPSHDHLATLMGVHRNTVLGYMQKLRETGWVQWEEADGQTNRYVLPARTLHKNRAGQSVHPAQNQGSTGTEIVQPTGTEIVHDQEVRHEIKQQEGSPPAPQGGDGSDSTAEAKIRPRRRLPADWTPGEQLRGYAVEHGVPPEAVDDFAEEFVNYWRGMGGKRVDWDATFRSRVLEHGRTFAKKNGHAPAAPRYYDDSPRTTRETPAPAPAQEEPGLKAARAAAAETERQERARTRIEQASQDPRRPVTVTPETWAGLPEEGRRKYAVA